MAADIARQVFPDLLCNLPQLSPRCSSLPTAAAASSSIFLASSSNIPIKAPPPSHQVATIGNNTAAGVAIIRTASRPCAESVRPRNLNKSSSGLLPGQTPSLRNHCPSGGEWRHDSRARSKRPHVPSSACSIFLVTSCVCARRWPPASHRGGSSWRRRQFLEKIV
jgi:hypothetical protein